MAPLLTLLPLLCCLLHAASAAEQLCPKAIVLNSYNYPTYYVTRDGKGLLHLQTGNGTRFLQRAALDGSKDSVSFEALTAPGYFLYNNDNMMYLKKNDKTDGFKKEASFQLVKGEEGFVRIVADAHPNHFVRHQDFKLKLHKWSTTDLFRKDSLFGIVCTTDKQFKLDICTSKFKLVSKNYPAMMLQSQVDKVTMMVKKEQASEYRFKSPALNGNPRAVSIESVAKPGYFLTTLEDHNVVLQKAASTDSYKAASSFKMVVMRNGFVRFQSVGNPRHYLRHSSYKLRLDRWANTNLYDLDSSWKVHCEVIPCKTKHFVYQQSYQHLHGPHCEFAPPNWHQINNWCLDKPENRPSPIRVDMAECRSKNKALKPIVLGSGWHAEREFDVVNNGHSLQANAKNIADLTVSGGNLRGVFNCFQFHFHWGSAQNMKNGVGSEHQLYDAAGQKVPTPMEVHIVCKRASMNVTAAVATPDAIAVLGGFIHPLQPGKHDGWAGHVVAQVLLNFAEIRTPAKHGAKSKGSVEKVQLQLRDLLPESIHRFINYDGAFTTPNCNPVAQWHLFPEPMKVRGELMLKFADAFFDAEKKRPMVDNFRPIMGRHGRKLRCSFGSGDVSKKDVAKATEGGTKALS